MNDETRESVRQCRACARSGSDTFYRLTSLIFLGILLLGMSAFCSCSSEQPAVLSKNAEEQRRHSLAVRKCCEFNLEGEFIQVFKLIPKGQPSGEIALKRVQNGKVDILIRSKFNEIKGGYLAVKRSDTGIDLAFDVKCGGSAVNSRKIMLPANAELASFGSGECTAHPGGSERQFWNQDFFVGESPKQWATGQTDFEGFVNETKRHPNRISYAVTIKLGFVGKLLFAH